MRLGAAKAKQAVDAAFANEIALQKVEPLIIESDLSIVALVGENMKVTSASAVVCSAPWERMVST